MSARSWIAIVVSPAVALAAQGTLYSMATPSCSTQTGLQLHLAAAVALAIVVVLGIVAFGESSLHRGEPTSTDGDEARRPMPRRFLADVATAVAGLAALVIVAIWFTLWVLSPCLR